MKLDMRVLGRPSYSYQNFDSNFPLSYLTLLKYESFFALQFNFYLRTFILQQSGRTSQRTLTQTRLIYAEDDEDDF